MPFVTYRTEVPISGSVQREVVGLYGTQAAANTAAAGDTALSAYTGTVTDDVEPGMWVSVSGAGAGSVGRILTLTLNQQRAAVLGKVCDWAEECMSRFSWTWRNFDGGTVGSEQQARWRHTYYWALSPCAAVQAAARAGWTVAELEMQFRVQQTLMPHVTELLHQWNRDHAHSSWSVPLREGSGRVTAQFNSSKSVTVSTIPSFKSDFTWASSFTWNTAANGVRPSASMTPQTTPENYRTV